MDYFLSTITDISLRRLYKFVLKRTIGKYLEDELLIDQLEVRSRDGLVRLNDIRLSADVLNEEFADVLPVKVVSITVTQLEVYLSYRTLLTDSCRFVVKGVNIVIAPNELYAKMKGSSKVRTKAAPSGGGESAMEGPPPPDIPQSAPEGQKSLSFIANWIEVIVARLQVQIEDINITLELPRDTASAGSSNGYGSSQKNLNRSKLTTAASHSVQLCLRNIHYFNDDPAAIPATDASSIAVSTKLTQGTDSSIALQLGNRKVVKLESITIQMVANDSGIRSNEGPLQLLRLGKHLTATVKLDRSSRGQLKGIDVELTVPSFLVSVDTHSAKCLSAAVCTYLALTSPESPKPGASASGRTGGAVGAAGTTQDTSKSIMQKILMSDPTLRTLFWLEEEENRKKKVGGKGGIAAGKIGGMKPAGVEAGDEIDFARVAQLMRQYRTTRNALAPDPSASTMGASSLGASAMLGASRVVDSDSDDEFPGSVAGSDHEGDDSSVDSDDFQDALARKPVTRVKMGEARRSALKGSTLRVSTYGAGSRAAMGESGLFQSTTSGLLGTTGAATSSSRVYGSGYHGSMYTTAPPPPLLISARLHIQSADIVFTHLAAREAILTPASSSGDQSAAAAEEASSTSSLSNSPRSSPRSGAGSSHRGVGAAPAPPRDELCLHFEEAVVRASTVIAPLPPVSAAPSQFMRTAAVAEPPRNSVTCTISVSEVQLWEAYSGLSYDALRERCALQEGTAQDPSGRSASPRVPLLPLQKQVILTFHSLQDSRRIYSSPHVNVTLDFVPAADKSLQLSPTADPSSCASIKVAVNLEPIIVSASVAMIDHWVQGLSGFPLIGVTEEESTTNIACTVNMVQVELFLHCDSRPDSYRAMSLRAGQPLNSSTVGGADAHTAYWDTVLDAVDLVHRPEAWASLHSTLPTSPYYEHLVATRGGFRFLLSDITIKLATAARPKGRGLDSTLLNGSTLGSGEKKPCRANSAEGMFQAVEMGQVALYVYISLPVTPSSAHSDGPVQATDPRRRFYSTLLAKATASEDGLYKVVISRTNPQEGALCTRLPSEDPEDQEFVLLKDAYRTAPSAPMPASTQPSAGTKKAGGSAFAPGTTTGKHSTDQGPLPPDVSSGNLIYVSAYHIHADIKQREYNVLMMVSDSIAPQPVAAPTGTTSPRPTPGTLKEPTSPTGAANGGFGFVFSSKLATICLSDNEPYHFDFPEFDVLIAETQRKSANARRQEGTTTNSSSKSTGSKTFSICVSIIEPSIEVMVANKDIYLSIKADDLSIYEMELPQFRALLQSGFDFNQTTGREARYGPNRHLVPFIRRASLHALDTSNGAARNELFSTLLGNNQDYGRAFEVRLLLSSTFATAASTIGGNPTEVKSVHFFIDFHDIMLSYDPQSTWILSVANMLTPQTAAQILCHRHEERVRAAIRRHQLLTPDQREVLGTTLDELVANLTAEQPAPLREPTPEPPVASRGTSPRSNGEGASKTPGKKGQITLALPFEQTKVNVRVRNCIVDYCCDPCKSRTFLTIGLLTVGATIVSNSPRFSLKFKVGGLSLYISDLLPLPTVLETGRQKGSHHPVATLGSSALANSLTLHRSGYRGGSRFRTNPGLFGAASQSAYDASRAAESAPGVEIYDEDIGQFFKAHSFVDLASVDHIDVLVTINNSEQEALVIQINIGQCAINACVDSLELFARTMGEWFLEFQVACAKSEEVMQKKSNKPVRDLGTSQYAFQAPTGNVLDDDNFDTIRFCDPLPAGQRDAALLGAGGGAAGQAGQAGQPSRTPRALPPALLQDVPLSDLIAHSEKESAARGIFVQSASTAAADMTDLVVEDYYSGFSMPTAEETVASRTAVPVPGSAALGGAVPLRPSDFAQMGASPAFPTSAYPASIITGGTAAKVQAQVPATSAAPSLAPPVLDRQSSTGTAKSSQMLEPQWEAQYDYDDDYCFHAPPAAQPSSVAVGGMQQERVGEEEEGMGGFYAAEEDQGQYDADRVERHGSSDEEGFEEANHASPEHMRAHHFEEVTSPGFGDEASVKSIPLDDFRDEFDGDQSGLDGGEDGEEPAAAQGNRSVFGIKNFSLWGSSAQPKKAAEEYELKDFNPAPLGSGGTEDDEAGLDGAFVAPPEPRAAPATRANVVPSPEDPEWMNRELSASWHTAPGVHGRNAHTVVATSHLQNAEFEYSSDPEDDGAMYASVASRARPSAPSVRDGTKGALQPQYEADFGEDEEQAPFVADFGDVGEMAVDDSSPAVEPGDGVIEASNLAVDTSHDTSGESEGWQRYPEGLVARSQSPEESTQAPTVTVPSTAAAGAALQSGSQGSPQLDDLDRAWQQQQGDYIYNGKVPAGAGQTGTVTRQPGVSPSPPVSSLPSGAAPAAPANSAPPVEGVRGAGSKTAQPMQAAQWYANPDQLEIMPHYIPVVSRSEDLDDNRPGEEKSLNTKMLMKLKGTFKIRLFEGTDWQRRAAGDGVSGSTEEAVDSKEKGLPESREQPNSTRNSAGAGPTAGSSAGAGGKAVRFRKEDLLKDLTTPVPGSSSRSTGPTSSASVRADAGHSSAARAKAAAGPTRPPRSSRPLFEESFTTRSEGEEAAADSGDKDKAAGKAEATASPQPAQLKPRNERDMLDATFKELFFCVRVYDNCTGGSAPVIYSLPSQRIALSTLDFLVSFGKVGQRRKKVVGSWTSQARPRDTLEPAIRVAFLAYENPPLAGATTTGGDSADAAASVTLEHRLYVRVLPVRVYLDEQVISFAKGLAMANAAESPAKAGKSGKSPRGSSSDTPQTASEEAGTSTAITPPRGDKELYFQSILIAALEIKIDYRASTVNIQALHKGDYLQLLNIFPLDGLEITLKHVKLNGVRGVPVFLQRVGEFWVKDIYANQLHRVLSGTAPFRGLSNVGNDLQELLAIPMGDYRKTGGVLKHLRRSTRTLVRTVTRETLHATQQLTMFVANAITELASDGPVAPPPGAHPTRTSTPPARLGGGSAEKGQALTTLPQGSDAHSHRRVSSEPPHQPAGVVEGLQMAYGSVARELGAAAETVIAIPIREYVQSGPGGYLKSVIRALPIAVLRPVAGAIEGVSYTMLGLRNDIDPAARLDEEDIWNVDIGTAFPSSPVRTAPASYQVQDNAGRRK